MNASTTAIDHLLQREVDRFVDLGSMGILDQLKPDLGANLSSDLPTGTNIEEPVKVPTPLSNSAPRETRLLLLEDHFDTRNAIMQMLRWNGFSVRATSTVGEAIEAILEEKFDLIVSDIGLPDGSGLDVMRFVRQHCGINGIAFSGYGTDDDIREGRDAGFVHYLIKPINLTTLIRLIRELTSD